MFVLQDATPQSAPPSPPRSTLGAVVVTARRPATGDLKAGRTEYRPEFFVPVRPSSALDMVSWLPGFVLEDTRDMRGLEGASGNVLIDGKPPTSKTDTLASVLRRLPADQVERVDLIVGGGPGIDMHGRDIIANVVLKRRDKPLKVVTAATYLDTHGEVSPALEATLTEKRGGTTLEASLQLVRNIAIYPTFGYGPWVRRDGAGAVQFAADARFQYDGPYVAASGSYEFPLAGGRLRANGLARLTHETLDEHDRLTAQGGAYGYRRENDFTETELGGRFERTLGRATLEAQALERYRRTGAQEDLQRPPMPSEDAFNTWMLESVQRAVLRWKRRDALTLEGSAEHALNQENVHTRASLAGAALNLPLSQVEVKEDRWDGGLALAWKLNGAVGMDLALKAERSGLQARGDAALSRTFGYGKPRLALSWSPNKATQLRMRGEHEVSQIPFGAFVTFNEYQSGRLRNGNPDIRPSRALVAEAVLERRFWSTGDLTLTVRYRALRDLLDVVARTDANGSAFQTIANIGAERETDLVGNLMVPLKGLGLGSFTLRGVATWQRARVVDPVSGRERNLSNVPEIQAELHFAQDFARWKTNWGVGAFYRGPSTLYRPFGNESIAGWPHVNVFIERRLPRDLAVRLELQNLPGAAPRGVVSVFQGLRDRSPLLYVDEKRLSVGPLLYLKLRKTF